MKYLKVALVVGGILGLLYLFYPKQIPTDTQGPLCYAFCIGVSATYGTTDYCHGRLAYKGCAGE